MMGVVLHYVALYDMYKGIPIVYNHFWLNIWPKYESKVDKIEVIETLWACRVGQKLTILQIWCNLDEN